MLGHRFREKLGRQTQPEMNADTLEPLISSFLGACESMAHDENVTLYHRVKFAEIAGDLRKLLRH